MKYAFIRWQRRAHCVSTLCRVLRVSRSGYYDWLDRGPSGRIRANARLLGHIRQVHARHRGHAGAVKTWKALCAEGVACGRHCVARLRRHHGIVAKRRRRFIATTRAKSDGWAAPNRLQRHFIAAEPNRVWVGDVTFVPTREGWLYLAVLLDLYSRLVVGWSMALRNDTALVLGALKMAVTHRQPPAGLIHHSDRGQTYAASVYRRRLEGYRMQASMSRKGDCWDNAVAESFFATLEFEVIENRVFATRDLAKTALFEFIEVVYNRQRLHETLGYKTPAQVERACPAAA